MLLILVFLVVGVFIEDSHESNLPEIPDLPDINATAGQSVVFNFTGEFNVSIEECKFGLNTGQKGFPNPLLLVVSWTNGNIKVDPKDNRMSFVGQRNNNVWMVITKLTTNDTNSYKVVCEFDVDGIPEYRTATANLYVQDKPDQPDTTTAAHTTTVVSNTTQATQATTSSSSKPSIRGSFFNMEFLVMAAMMYLNSM